MKKVILFYKFVPLSDPEAVQLWQRLLAERYNLKGRIIISRHGINGTLGGELDDVKAYVKETKLFVPFKKTVFKWSEAEGNVFPKLSVKVRPELVSFGAPYDITVDQNGVVNGGKHLKPKEVNKLVAEREDVIFFDGRNAYEAEVGRFKNAIVPDVEYTRDFLNELSSDKYNSIKDKPVVTYCTGGIRCEVLSALMKKRGFKEVYQIDGGIVKYGEAYGDQGLWEGSLYVFDGRMGLKFSDQAKDIGKCSLCNKKTSNYDNCSNVACNKLILKCLDCQDQLLCRKCQETVVSK